MNAETEAILKLWHNVSVTDRLLVADYVIRFQCGDLDVGGLLQLETGRLANELSREEPDKREVIDLIRRLANRAVLEREARPQLDFTFEDIEYGLGKAIEHRLARMPTEKPVQKANGEDDHDDRD